MSYGAGALVRKICPPEFRERRAARAHGMAPAVALGFPAGEVDQVQQALVLSSTTIWLSQSVVLSVGPIIVLVLRGAPQRLALPGGCKSRPAVFDGGDGADCRCGGPLLPLHDDDDAGPQHIPHALGSPAKPP